MPRAKSTPPLYLRVPCPITGVEIRSLTSKLKRLFLYVGNFCGFTNVFCFLGGTGFFATGGLVLEAVINRASYMSAHVLLNLLNELGKRDKIQ